MASGLASARPSQKQSPLAVTTRKSELLKRAVLALSIANLCFLFVWSEILHVATDRRFLLLLGTRPDRSLFWALALNVVVLGAVLFALLMVRRRGSRTLRLLATAVLVLVCLFALYQCQRSFNGFFYGVWRPHSILVLRIVLASIIFFLILRRPRLALPGLRTFFLMLSPLFLVFVAQGITAYYSAPRQLAQRAAGMLPRTASQSRVIWIIFDELDYRLLFEARPAQIQLPHFDALRQSSVFADHVHSPAHNTLSAVLSLLLSKRIPNDDAVNLYARPVHVRFSGCSQWANLRTQENVFGRARNLGFNTAVSGWYHPYCRYFGNDLSACATTVGAGMALIPQQLLRSRSFIDKAAFLANWQARSLPLAGRLQWIASMPHEARYYRELHIIRIRAVLKRGMEMLKDRKLNFVLLHLPVPHPPGVWNIHTESFGTDDQLNYLDNLELADRTLGEIRTLLEQAGDWDRSTILVSADHPYRPDLWLTGPAGGELSEAAFSEMVQATRHTWQPNIPFFLKLPGQKTGIEYHREFNSVLSANLLLAALQGQVRTPADAAQWLDAHAAASEQKVCHWGYGSKPSASGQPNPKSGQFREHLPASPSYKSAF